jgi:hypothetical protein
VAGNCAFRKCRGDCLFGGYVVLREWVQQLRIGCLLREV